VFVGGASVKPSKSIKKSLRRFLPGSRRSADHVTSPSKHVTGDYAHHGRPDPGRDHVTPDHALCDDDGWPSCDLNGGPDHVTETDASGTRTTVDADDLDVAARATSGLVTEHHMISEPSPVASPIQVTGDREAAANVLSEVSIIIITIMIIVYRTQQLQSFFSTGTLQELTT